MNLRDGTWNTIEDPSVTYDAMKVITKNTYKYFYKRIEVFGKENIPHDHPVIFAPNHQNAVMDPLAILHTQKSYVVFLARSDIFKSKFLIRIFTFLRILPIYRQRDGVENLTKNDEIFDITLRILKKKKKICLMAEGNHGNQNKLRPLVKGMFRIAFTAQDNLDDASKPVQIVPTGIYYQDYAKADKILCINYGKPISLADYHGLYKEKPALAINKLKNDLQESLIRYMVHIKSDENYESANFITNVFSTYHAKKERKPYFNIVKKYSENFNLQEDKKAIFLPQLEFLVGKYKLLLEKYNVRDWVVKKRKFSYILLIFNLLTTFVLSPLFICSLVLNGLPTYFSIKPTKKVKDRQFHSSVKYVIFLIFVLLYYPIISIATGLIFNSIIIGISTLVSSILLGKIALQIQYLFKKTMAGFRFLAVKRKHREDYNQMNLLRIKIKILADYVYYHE